jgi:hypothetical protein
VEENHNTDPANLQQLKLRFAGCFGPICLLQPVERAADPVLIKDWERSVIQDRKAAGRTTTDGISKTYKDCERLTPSVLVEYIDDLLVPNQVSQ